MNDFVRLLRDELLELDVALVEVETVENEELFTVTKNSGEKIKVLVTRSFIYSASFETMVRRLKKAVIESSRKAV